MLRCNGHPETLFRLSTTVVVNGISTTRGIRDTPDSVRQTNVLVCVAKRVPRWMVTCPGPLGFHRLRRHSGRRNLGALPWLARRLRPLRGADEERGGT
eukprot:10495846-Alexandrium_andersonii.AAC.1